MGYNPFGCRYDVNGDNEVSLDELSSMINELHAEVVDAPWMSDEYKAGMAGHVMADYDMNGDEVLDKEEFVHLFVTKVAEAPWSGAEWAVALRFDHPRATVLVLLLG